MIYLRCEREGGSFPRYRSRVAGEAFTVDFNRAQLFDSAEEAAFAAHQGEDCCTVVDDGYSETVGLQEKLERARPVLEWMRENGVRRLRFATGFEVELERPR